MRGRTDRSKGLALRPLTEPALAQFAHEAMHRFPGDRPGADEDPGPEVRHGARARTCARTLVLRMAFVGAATCGFVLSAGAAAHADTPSAGTLVTTATQTVSSTVTSEAGTTTDAVAPVVDTATSGAQTAGEVVETTVDTVTKTVDTVTTTVDTFTKTVDTAAKTIDTVTNTAGTLTTQTVHAATSTIGGVTRTVDTATGDLSSRVADTGGALLETARDGAGSVPAALTGPVDEVMTAVRLAAEPSFGRGNGARAAVAGFAARRSATLGAPATLGGTSSTTPVSGRARAPEPPGSVPPFFPLGGSAPAWPLAPTAAGLALTLVGALLLRTTASPPMGWRRHTLATIPFHGAAVALAVERPG
jgi:hypothetical protein